MGFQIGLAEFVGLVGSRDVLSVSGGGARARAEARLHQKPLVCSIQLALQACHLSCGLLQLRLLLGLAPPAWPLKLDRRFSDLPLKRAVAAASLGLEGRDSPRPIVPAASLGPPCWP